MPDLLTNIALLLCAIATTINSILIYRLNKSLFKLQQQTKHVRV